MPAAFLHHLSFIAEARRSGKEDREGGPAPLYEYRLADDQNPQAAIQRDHNRWERGACFEAVSRMSEQGSGKDKLEARDVLAKDVLQNTAR